MSRNGRFWAPVRAPAKRAAPDRVLGDEPEPAFNLVEPARVGRRVMKMKARVARQPRLHSRMFVGGRNCRRSSAPRVQPEHCGRGDYGLTPVSGPTSQRELGAGEPLGFGGPKLELVLRGV